VRRRLAAVVLAVSCLTAACVTNTDFNREADGVCYRTRTEKAFWVIPVSSTEVQAVSENCG
jgi:hypothetical protein